MHYMHAQLSVAVATFALPASLALPAAAAFPSAGARRGPRCNRKAASFVVCCEPRCALGWLGRGRGVEAK